MRRQEQLSISVIVPSWASFTAASTTHGSDGQGGRRRGGLW
jgi:hypothetical protein